MLSVSSDPPREIPAILFILIQWHFLNPWQSGYRVIKAHANLCTSRVDINPPCVMFVEPLKNYTFGLMAFLSDIYCSLLSHSHVFSALWARSTEQTTLMAPNHDVGSRSVFVLFPWGGFCTVWVDRSDGQLIRSPFVLLKDFRSCLLYYILRILSRALRKSFCLSGFPHISEIGICDYDVFLLSTDSVRAFRLNGELCGRYRSLSTFIVYFNTTISQSQKEMQ